MTTRTISTYSQEERQQLAIDLLTQTTVTKRNYYSLYIDNAQVNCICKIWNRIVYCLYGWWLGWFLGKAGDENKENSIKLETIQIYKYNHAKKALFDAHKTLKHFDASKNPEDQDRRTQCKLAYEAYAQAERDY